MIPLVMSVIAKTETFERKMSKARGSIGKFDKSVKRTRQTMMGLGRSLMAVVGVGGGLYMIGNMLRSGVRDAAAFEKQMAMVSTMLDDQSMSIMPHYEQQIRAMSKQFGEGTDTLSKGLYDILSASIAPAKALKVLTVSTKAAKAGLTDTGVAADAITTILNSYSLEASRAGDVSDKLFAIVKRGKTTFADLAPNIGKVAALAATAGLSFDDLGATLATMTRAGVQTEIAITSLRAIMLSFLKPLPDSIVLARKYGVELNSNTLRTIGLTGVIEKLKKATAEELAVIVPTSRAITGFAAAIQKAAALASDYDFILSSLGRTEEAYQKIAETSAYKIDQLKQEWKDLGRTLGEVALDTGIVELLSKINETLSKSIERVKKLPEFFSRLGYVLKTGKRWTPLAEFEGGAGGGRFGGHGASGGWGEPAGEVLAKSAIEAPPAGAGVVGTPEDAAKASAAANAKILADTREKLASIRSMDYMTRMEKIQNLKDYMAAHGHTMAGVTEAEKLLAAEITSIQSSRLDAMKVYQAELREDMQESSLYISEKFTEAAQGIESSMSSAFQSMIQGGANFRDAMRQFFIDIGASFAKMAADMAARAAMSAIMNAAAVIGGAVGAGAGAATGGGAYGGTGGGGPTGGASRSMIMHSGYVPYGTPSFQQGRGLKPNEMAAIIEKDEMLVPNKQIAKGVSGSPDFEPKFNIIIVRDEKAAQIEAMNSKEGEKSYIRHAMRNRNI